MPKNTTVNFYPNISGWTLCGLINKFSGVPFYYSLGIVDEKNDRVARPPTSATSRQATEWAGAIRASLRFPTRLQDILDAAPGCIEPPTIEAVAEYISEYASFLERCDGYELLD